MNRFVVYIERASLSADHYADCLSAAQAGINMSLGQVMCSPDGMKDPVALFIMAQISEGSGTSEYPAGPAPTDSIH